VLMTQFMIAAEYLRVQSLQALGGAALDAWCIYTICSIQSRAKKETALLHLIHSTLWKVWHGWIVVAVAKQRWRLVLTQAHVHWRWNAMINALVRWRQNAAEQQFLRDVEAKAACFRMCGLVRRSLCTWKRAAMELGHVRVYHAQAMHLRRQLALQQGLTGWHLEAQAAVFWKSQQRLAQRHFKGRLKTVAWHEWVSVWRSCKQQAAQGKELTKRLCGRCVHLSGILACTFCSCHSQALPGELQGVQKIPHLTLQIFQQLRQMPVRLSRCLLCIAG
jgi:hypothetical protein